MASQKLTIKKSSKQDKSNNLSMVKTIKGVKREFLENDDDKKIAKKIRIESEITNLWKDYEVLSETQNIPISSAKAIIKLFEEENTIPFIARYRRDKTNNLSAEQLRDIKQEYDRIQLVKLKATKVLQIIEKQGNLDTSLEKSILSAQTIEELEHIYAPYKPESKRSLAERAKALGLKEPALNLLNNSQYKNFEEYLDHKDLNTIQDVEKGIVHIIASIIATDMKLLTYLRKLRSEINFNIESKKCNLKKKSTTESNASTSKTTAIDNNQEMKYATYFDFNISSKYIKPHQILAINRGVSLKILSLAITVPTIMFEKFFNFCVKTWINSGRFDSQRKTILETAIKDSYTRLVKPLIVREVRSELKVKAEKASYEVFSSNLKQLLLMPPLRGKSIMGIDPGFLNGCKLAVISSTGVYLSSGVIYPHRKNSKGSENAQILKNLLMKHNCDLIALGNGTACRETESWISDLIQKHTFTPLDVTYTIVNESGASIYSCSAEAKKEFPTLDPNIISAVSLARRIQEPLAELVKVEPKHLGVGMYQHDLPKKQLEQALDEVVMECVSFVGVDLNTASQCLLKRIAGLSDKRALNIIEYRNEKEIFKSRKELLNVKGIGSKVFQQCAGFLRVGPANINQEIFYQDSSTNRLDSTYIHPESYNTTLKLFKKLNLESDNVGQIKFIETIKRYNHDSFISDISLDFDSSPETIKQILDTLTKPLNFDLRQELNNVPLFKKGLANMQDLKIGSTVTGVVNNITHFGCFIDIGVGQAGLIHQSKLNGYSLQIGDRIEVKVINIDIARKRISLEMVNKI